MSIRALAIAGIVAAALCLGVATRLYPGGFDWNRDYISTLLRGPAGPARWLADAGVILFCTSVALLFERLARSETLPKKSSLIRISGIGSQVYEALTITPLHDLMVNISGAFLLVAMVSILWTLYSHGKLGRFVFGCLALLVLLVGAAVYYTGHFESVLPWVQRLWLTLFAVWMVGVTRDA